MKRRTIWMLGTAIAIVLELGCAAMGISRPAATDPNAIQGNAIIDWIDFVRWNGQNYDRLYNAALTSPDRVGKPLGTIRFRLEGHVGNPHYVAKDGDAAFLNEGTALYEIAGYSDGTVMASASPRSPNGYLLYAVRQSRPELFRGLEPDAQRNAPKKVLMMTLSPDAAVPLHTFTGAGAQQFFDVLKRSGDPQPEPSLDETWTRYGFILDTGDAIGYFAQLYRKGDQLYWESGGFHRLPAEALLFVNRPRETVFTTGGIEFPLPGQNRLASGETIAANGNFNNISVRSPDGKNERLLFPISAYEDLAKKVSEVNPGEGEAKTILYWATNPIAANAGTAIAYATNREDILTKAQHFDIRLIQPDGTKDRLLVDGRIYGDAFPFASAGVRLIATTSKRTLLDIRTDTGEIRDFPFRGHLLALSQDGRYALYLNMENDAKVGRELRTLDLETGETSSRGEAPKDLIFLKGIK
jgi:hypothetical protein